MNRKILFIVLALLTFTLSNSQSSKNFIDQPYLELVGTSETEIVPDEIYVRIVLNENDKRGKQSIEEQENIMINKLKSIGVDVDNCLKVMDLEGYYQRKFLSSNEVVKIKSYELLVSDGKLLGEVFKTLDEIEISNASIVRISHSRIDELTRKNKIEAIKIAKSKAEDYALALDQEIGKAIHIEELQGMNHLVSNQSNTFTANGTIRYKEEYSQIPLRKITIKSSIQVKFILN